MGDFTYRTREAVEEWKKLCPIERLKSRMIAEFDFTSSAIEQIQAEVADLVKQGRDFAESSPRPDPKTATDHVYSPISLSIDEPAPNANDRSITFAQATLEALTEAMEADPNIFVMGEGIGVRGGNFRTTAGLFDRFGPARLCDTPICERGFVGLACGAAMTGTRPVIDFMFADFVLDSIGEIFNQIAKIQYMSSGRLTMPVLLRGCIGIGHSAATHHSGSYYGMYAQVPGLVVVVPSSARDAKGLMRTALKGNDPVVFLEHREILQAKGPVPEGDYSIPFGKASVVRSGKDLTIVALAKMVHLAQKVAEDFAAKGVSLEIIDPRTVLPLDTKTILQSVQKTGRLLIIDEAPPSCGFAAEVAARVSDAGFDFLDAPIKRLCGTFAPTPYSPELEAVMVPTANDITQAILSLLEE